MSNEDFLKLDEKTRNDFNKFIEFELFILLQSKDDITKFAFEKLYKENLSLNYIVNTYDINKEDLIKAKEELLYMINDINTKYKNKVNEKIKVLTL